MKINKTESLSLKTSQKTEEVGINGSGPLSIQPVVQNLCGTPTYTLEASNDKENFVCYDLLSTNVPFTYSLQINYEKIPWKYFRISINSKLGDSGSVVFIFNYQGE